MTISISEFAALCVAFLKLLVAISPLSLFWFFGFSKWKKQYGGGTWLGYVYRFALGKPATDDTAGIILAKAAFLSVWFTVSMSVLF
ncbi:hypothetical protein [Roseovarius azorensis]|uniref:hypothetical protein n=1 Tax=Roseovarius azorensis TaxID=1287727 RepID=UPI000B85AFCD|nr:hypothetical protein [Roseovarius azorensis]